MKTLHAKTWFMFIYPAIWTVIIIFMSLLPADDIPESPWSDIPHFDKLVHAGLYFVQAILLVRPFIKVQLPAFFYTVVFSLLLGGGLEMMQHFLTRSRSGSWYDLLADVTGSVAGILVWRLYNSKVTRQ